MPTFDFFAGSNTTAQNNNVPNGGMNNNTFNFMGTQTQPSNNMNNGMNSNNNFANLTNQLNNLNMNSQNNNNNTKKWMIWKELIPE